MDRATNGHIMMLTVLDFLRQENNDLVFRVDDVNSHSAYGYSVPRNTLYIDRDWWQRIGDEGYSELPGFDDLTQHESIQLHQPLVIRYKDSQHYPRRMDMTGIVSGEGPDTNMKHYTEKIVRNATARIHKLVAPPVPVSPVRATGAPAVVVHAQSPIMTAVEAERRKIAAAVGTDASNAPTHTADAISDVSPLNVSDENPGDQTPFIPFMARLRINMILPPDLLYRRSIKQLKLSMLTQNSGDMNQNYVYFPMNVKLTEKDMDMDDIQQLFDEEHMQIAAEKAYKSNNMRAYFPLHEIARDGGASVSATVHAQDGAEIALKKVQMIIRSNIKLVLKMLFETSIHTSGKQARLSLKKSRRQVW